MADQIKEPTSLEEEKQLPSLAEKLEEGAVKEPKEGAGDKEVKTPEPKSYSEEDWNKRQSAWDTQTSALTKEREAIAGQLAQIQEAHENLRAQTEEQKLADWLKSVETDGGDVNQARQIVEAQKQVSKQIRDIEKRERQLSEQTTKAGIALKLMTAKDLIKEHDLGDDALEGLLKSEDPTAMENQALKLKIAKSLADAKPKTPIGGGVPTTKGLDLSKLSLTERAGRAIEEEEQSRR